MGPRRTPVAPFIPLATQTYDPRNIEQINRALRLYFNQLDSLNQTTVVDLDSAILSAGNAEQKAVEAMDEVVQLRDNIVKQFNYGSFYDTTTQTAAVANTAYAMTFNSTDTAATNGVSINTPASHIKVDRAGVYNVQFSAQLYTTSGGTHQTWIWLRVDGTDVPYSATKVTIEGNNTAVVAAWNFLVSLNAGSYFELMWEASDTNVQIRTEAASAVHPAIPSVILTVTDNFSDAYV